LKRNLDSIQCLRGFAAVAVALHHASIQIEELAPFKDGTKTFWLAQHFSTYVGAIGVDIFFLISGFIMAYTTYLKPEMTGTEFLQRRFVRIYPLYWFFSFVVIGLQLTPWIGWNPVSLSDSIKAFLLYPEFVHYSGMTFVRPVFLAQGWTLIYEVLFYLLFATFIAFSPLRRAGLITAVFGLLALTGTLLIPGRPETALVTDSILLEFSLGLIIGWAFTTDRVRVTRPWLITGLSVSAAILVAELLCFDRFRETPRLLHFGLPSLLLVGSLILSPVAESWHYPRFLKLLGDASYSIYLTHTIVLLLFHTGYIRLGFMQALPYDLYFGLLITVIVASGLVSYFLVEKPLLNLCRRRS
jgi:exopolysaccharide production protein ExoZ